MRPLAEVVNGAEVLLVDFDGPICAVFAGYSAATIASDLQALIRSHLSGELPPSIAALSMNPLQILREVADLGDNALAVAVAVACRDAEVMAAATATPTLGAVQLFEAAQASGRPVIIVSNNATEAVGAYLQKHDLSHYIEGVAARFDGMDPRLLKPDPFLLHRGLEEPRALDRRAIFIGDSTTDVEAGLAVSIPTIGYANKPGKDHRLSEAGAVVVTDSMLILADEVRRTPAARSR
ncbi:HAD family hydrolase [Winogradskya consettensis]|uniref:Hydrolase n=1 Tax=Winogradskya consettensis TaxID=113560 RepID=A0A919VYX7_9ACTN|nr:HAD family hydrolase [Actinoplanes consettensis]GIM83854.1 hydrolase [Actinoplanes consettensis]